MTKENRASGTDHSEKVISITFSGNKKESIRDGHPLPYASASHTLLLFDFPYYTRLGTNTIKRLPLLYPIWYKSGSKTGIYTHLGIFSLIISDYIYDFPDIFSKTYFLLSITFLFLRKLPISLFQFFIVLILGISGSIIPPGKPDPVFLLQIGV